MNPKGAAMGRPDVSNINECAVNCDAVLYNARIVYPATFVNVAFVAFLISIHLTYPPLV
jgi:hypothetical protein